jgi:UDP-glucuronate decarboxylase
MHSLHSDPEEHPQKEEYWGHVNPIGPRACYDEAKRVAETMCYAYHKQEGVSVRVARIFNTFGPRMHMNDGRVVSNFILQSLQNQPITVSTFKLICKSNLLPLTECNPKLPQ